MAVLVSAGVVLVSSGGILVNEVGVTGIFDDPANWMKYAGNPILQGDSGQWDAYWIQPDSVIDLGTGTLYIYYGGDSVDIPSHIGLATSTDGYSWSKYGSNPIFSPGSAGQWDDYRITHFAVLKEGASWKAWYAGDRAITPNWRIGYATSADGISWTRYGANPVLGVGGVGTWDSIGVVPSHVFKEGSTYYMYYWGYSSIDQSTWSIGLATSPDGITWTKEASNPVLAGDTGNWDDGVIEPFSVKLGGTYYIFYQGNTADQVNSAIGVARTTDKINLTRSATNPFPRGGPGSWDSLWGEAPKLIHFGGEWLLYYMSCDGLYNNKKIGVMTFTP